MNSDPPVSGAEPPDAAAVPQAHSAGLQDYGPPLSRHPPYTLLRLATLNIRGFPFPDTAKAIQFQDLLRHTVPDVLMLSETNINWSKVPIYRRLPDLMSQWVGQSVSTSAHNIHVRFSSTSVYGGTSITSFGPTSSRILKMGRDPTGLGRWAWQLHRGKSGRIVCLISAYCPNRTTGPKSVFTQHLTHFVDCKASQQDPIRRFLDDLSSFIQAEQDQDHLIILGVDANHPLTSSNAFTNRIQMLQLWYPTLRNSEKGHGPPPATRYPGSQVIDGLFVSQGLTPLATGFSTAALPTNCDHSLVWMDFDVPHVYGSTLPFFVRPNARRLNEDPRVQQTFQDILHAQCTRRQVFTRLRSYQQYASTLSPEQHIHHWMSLWTRLKDAVDFAERRCRKFRFGRVPWTPEWQQIQEELLFWQTRIKQLHGHKISIKSFLRLAQRLGLSDLTRTPLYVATQSLRLVLDRRRQYKSSAKAKRQTYLQQLAEAHAQQNNTSVEVALKQLQQREIQRRDARRIKAALRPFTSRGLTVVQGPDPTSPPDRTEFTTDSGVAAACLAENARRFRQARDTPWLTPPLYQAAGRIGLTDVMEHILAHGSFPPDFPTEDIDPWVLTMLPYWQRPADVSDFSWQYDPEAYAHSWSKIPATTSSGPDGISFIHMKTIAQDPRLRHLPAYLAWAPFHFGFIPPAWLSATNVMLEKVQNNVNVEKLRAIALLDSLFNHNNKNLGRQLMANAEHHHLVAREQYGSRKKHECIDQSLNKILTTDYWRTMHYTGAICSTDLKSCYDRIVHSVATLCCRRWGAPISVLNTAFGALADMNFRVRTAFGDSSDSFQGTETDPIHGVCQGDGAGPTFWACVSSPVFEMMRASHQGVHYRTPVSQRPVDFVGFAFVDDTDKCTQATSATAALHRMQNLLNMWQGGSRVSGGKLVPEKSHWYLVEMAPDSNGAYHYVNHAPQEFVLTLDDNGTPIPLQLLPVSEPRRTLGIQYAPDGEQITELDRLRTKCETWAHHIRTSSLPRHLVWQAYHTNLLKSIEFVLPVTSFTEADCDWMIRPALQILLQCSGFTKSFPRAIVYGPTELQGLAIPNIYDTQGLQHVSRLLDLATKPHLLTHQLLLTNIEALQMETGSASDPLNLPSSLLDLASNTWLTTLLRFARTHKWDFHSDLPRLTALWSNDLFLMDVVATRLPLPDRIHFNRCRIFLQVTTLGELLDASGTHLLPWAWTGSSRNPFPQYSWPRQTRPPDHLWNTWQHTLSSVFQVSPHSRGPLTNGILLSWRSPWWISPDASRLYHITPDGTVSFPSAPRSRRMPRVFLNHPESAHRVSPKLCPVHILATDSHLLMLGSPGRPPGPSSSSSSSRLPIFLRNRPTTEAWLYKDMDIDDTALFHAWTTGLLRHGSDGSFADSIGTASCRFWDGSVFQRIQFAVPGLPEDQTAFRSELAGIYAQARFLLSFCLFHDLCNTTFTIACDGKSALETSFHTRVKWDTPQRDFVSAFQAVQREAADRQIFFTPKHVLGHQDKNPWNTLDLYATINQLCDSDAVDLRRHLYRNGHHAAPRRIWGETWILRINTERIVRDISHSMRLSLTWPRTLTYLVGARTGHMDLNTLAYPSLSHAMRNAPSGRARWVAKHFNGFGPVGRVMLRRKEWVHPNCPRCGRYEDHHHVWKCPHQDAVGVWLKHLEALEDWMLDTNCDPDIQVVVCTRLSEWLSGAPGPDLSSLHPDVLNVLALQDTLGWELPFTGFWPQAWIDLQAQYFQALGSRQSSKVWWSRLIRKIWEIAWHLWIQRNDFLHRQNNTRTQLSLVRQIRAIYHLPRSDLNTACLRLFIPLPDLLTRPIPALQAWLVAYRTYSQVPAASLQRMLSRQRRRLRSIGPTPSAPSPPTTAHLAQRYEAARLELRKRRLQGHSLRRTTGP